MEFKHNRTGVISLEAYGARTNGTGIRRHALHVACIHPLRGATERARCIPDP